MSPEEKARLAIDQKLIQSGWVIQDTQHLNLSIALGVAVREFPTSTGVNTNLKMSIFAEAKCNFSPVSTEVYTTLYTTSLAGLKAVLGAGAVFTGAASF